MSELLPSPIGCCDPCTPSGSSGPPGEQGPPGAAGENGADGVDAVSLAVGGELMPAADGSSSVTIVTTTSTAWMGVGEPVWVEGWGFMEVDAVPSDLTVTLINLDDGTNYADNSAPGTVLTASSRITPGGWQGPAGTADTALFLLKASNLGDVANAATSRGNLGLGTAATKTSGVANGNLPPVDTTFTNGDAVFATATGAQTKTAANARTALGLGTAAVEDVGTGDDKVPMVDDASGLTTGQIVRATANGVESVDNATILAQLGIGGSGTSMLLYQHISSSDGGSFIQGARRTVPLNTEVVDQGNYGSITGSQITLAAGTYRFRFGVLANEVDAFFGYLYNITAGAIIQNVGGVHNTYGTTAFTDNGFSSIQNGVFSFGQGRFTLGVSSVIELSAECSLTKNTDGFGVATGLAAGGNHYYSWLELEKEG